MNYGELFRVTLPETVLEIAALLVLLVDLAFLRKAAMQVRAGVAAVLGVVGCGASIVALYNTLGGNVSFGGALLLSSGGVVAVAQIAILALTALTLLLLIDSEFTRHPGEFVAVVLMAASGGLIISAAQDLLVIFAGLELLSISLYVLTAFGKTSAKSAEAALKYYLFGGMSAAFLLFGFSYLYGLSGSTNLNVIARAAIASPGSGSPLFYLALVLVAVGLGFKVAAAPFHLWAADTYEGAPVPAAAFIASVSKVASFALLIGLSEVIRYPFGHVHGTVRFMMIHSGPMSKWLGFSMPWTIVFALLAAASIKIGNLAALAQRSVRRLLAYSAVVHAGYMLIALAWFSEKGAQAILYYILTYGVTTIGAFGVVSVVERVTGSDKMDAFLGLHKRNPLLAGVLLVLFLSLAGIPPLVGFWAKFNLFAAVLSVGAGVWPFILVAFAVAFSAVSLYYYLQVLKRVYVMPVVDETPIRVHPATMVVLLTVAAAVVVLGCFPALLQDWIAQF